MTENYNTDLAQIVPLESGKLGIKTPYNESFVKELKASVPSSSWSRPYWTIAPSGEDQAKELLAKYFPAKEILTKVRITWDLSREAPQIDGVNLASISRDWWNWRKDCPLDFKVIEQDLESGGSQKNPGLFGKLIIEASVRPGAIVTPKAEIEIVEAGEKPNPLAGFSTEELLAELKRRGE